MGWKIKLPRYVITTEENLRFEMETGVPYTYILYRYSNEIENVDIPITKHQNIHLSSQRYTVDSMSVSYLRLHTVMNTKKNQ